jgi:hypothetical protein
MSIVTCTSKVAGILLLAGSACVQTPKSTGETFGSGTETSGGDVGSSTDSESGDPTAADPSASEVSGPPTGEPATGDTGESSGTSGTPLQCFTPEAPPSAVNPTGVCDPYLMPFKQDCPAGQKCTYWADDGGDEFSASTCVPLVDNRQGGDPCTIDGSPVSGLDGCDMGQMCYFAFADSTGSCVALCGGSATSPTCDNPDDVCVVVHDTAAVCLPRCNPLFDSCGFDGSECMLNGEAWVCLDNFEGDEGPGGEIPCEHSSECADGYSCLYGECRGKCDVSDSDCNCIPQCDAEKGYEDAGLCL